jgi:hypothetical protein
VSFPPKRKKVYKRKEAFWGGEIQKKKKEKAQWESM